MEDVSEGDVVLWREEGQTGLQLIDNALWGVEINLFAARVGSPSWENMRCISAVSPDASSRSLLRSYWWRREKIRQAAPNMKRSYPGGSVSVGESMGARSPRQRRRAITASSPNERCNQ